MSLGGIWRRCNKNKFFLVTTSTLSMGVNLPANLVIIKSTMQYADNTYKEYPESALFQMIGRAGRPQFDTSATAVIMTSAQTKVSTFFLNYNHNINSIRRNNSFFDL